MANIFKTSNILRSVWTQMGICTLWCLIIAGRVMTPAGSCPVSGNGIPMLCLQAAGIIFIVWFVLLAYLLLSKRVMTPMDPRGYKYLDIINFVLLLVAGVTNFVSTPNLQWLLPAIILVWLASLFIGVKYRRAKV